MQMIAREVEKAVLDLFGVGEKVELTRPEPQFGDFSTNVALKLAKSLSKNPREVAEDIVAKLDKQGDFSEVSVAGPGFINIWLTDAKLLDLAENVGSPSKVAETVVIETNNPNPFKAMHIGHALNAITADTIANLIEESVESLYRVSYHGDVGLHVGKSMYALLRYVENAPDRLLEVPESERNSFMSRMYAEGSRAYKEDEQAKAEINELSKQSFTREDEVYAQVYDTVFNWSFEEIDSVMKRLGNKSIERRFLESQADTKGVEIVRKHVPAVFQESDGAIIFKGSDYSSFDNAFIGSNGFGLYGARDIGLMELKNEQYHPNKSYIVTAEEQKDYFKGVIAAAGLVWPERKDQTVNIPTGTLKLTTGKMSSRDGDVVEIAWLFSRIAEAVKERGGEPTEEVVAGALRYAFLKVRVGVDVIFDVNEAVSLQGNSGPYLQYAHARACSVVEKAGQIEDSKVESSVNLEAGERNLARKLGEYSEALERSKSELLPHHVCTYLYELAQEFNRFYEHNQVIGHEREALRLRLVSLYRDTLARGLGILGIVAPERM